MFEKRFLLSFSVVFLFLFAFDYFFHGVLLMEIYEQSPALWRPREDLPQYLPFLVFGQFTAAFVLTLMFKVAFPGKGVLKGFIYGLFIYGLYVATEFIRFAVQPLPLPLFLFYLLGYFIEISLAGIILALIYSPPKRHR